MSGCIVISANTSWYLFNFRKNTILALIDKGYRVVCVAPLDDYSKKLIVLGAEYEDVAMDAGGTNPLKDLKTMVAFRGIYNRIRPNVVLNFTPKNNVYSTIAARMVGAKVINNIAGLGTMFERITLPALIARALFKISQPLASHVFFQNEDDRDVMLRLGAVKNHKTQRLFGSGVDITRFAYTDRSKSDITRFVFVGRLLQTKGVELYLQAAAQLQEMVGNKVECLVVGIVDQANPNAIDMTSLEAAHAAGIVNYLGSSDNIEQVLRNVDAIVLPSFYKEGVPKSLLEAGAMGKAIITTDNVGCRETLVDKKTGFLCEPKSLPSLVDAMTSYMFLSQEQKHAMGLASHQFIVSKFDENKNIHAYLQVIDNVLNQEGS